MVGGMPANATEFQRAFMKTLYRAYGGDEAAVCAAYTRAEAEGRVFRKAGDLILSPERYAAGLWQDGKTKGWLAEPNAK